MVSEKESIEEKGPVFTKTEIMTAVNACLDDDAEEIASLRRVTGRLKEAVARREAVIARLRKRQRNVVRSRRALGQGDREVTGITP